MNRSEFLKLTAFLPIAAKSVVKSIADDVQKDNNAIFSRTDYVEVINGRNRAYIFGHVEVDVQRDLINVSSGFSGYDEFIPSKPEIKLFCNYNKIKGDIKTPFLNCDLIDYKYFFKVKNEEMCLHGEGYITDYSLGECTILPSGEVTLQG